jgi:hypothetical protein
MQLQTQNVVLKTKTTTETHGHVPVYKYLLKSGDEQVGLIIASADDAIEVGQEFEVHLVPVTEGN